MTLESAVYLIPVTLGDTPIEQVLPSHNREVIIGIKHFIVENIRSARRFLKKVEQSINIDNKNRLHPFYMVYLADDGTVICDHLQPKRLLDVMRHVCRGKNKPDQELCAIINKETADGRRMQRYSDLLANAIDSIITVKEESDIDSLFSMGETTALLGEVKGLDDFELITFLIIR